MKEVRRILRISEDPAKNSTGFLLQLNAALGQIMDMVDQSDGHRGTPTYYTNPDLQTHRITNVGSAIAGKDALTKDQAQALIDALNISIGTRTVPSQITTVIDSVHLTDGDGAAWNYTARMVSIPENVRTGLVLACWDYDGNIQSSEARPRELGVTTDCIVSVRKEGVQIQLVAFSTMAYKFRFRRQLIV